MVARAMHPGSPTGDRRRSARVLRIRSDVGVVDLTTTRPCRPREPTLKISKATVVSLLDGVTDRAPPANSNIAGMNRSDHCGRAVTAPSTRLPATERLTASGEVETVQIAGFPPGAMILKKASEHLRTRWRGVRCSHRHGPRCCVARRARLEEVLVNMATRCISSCQSSPARVTSLPQCVRGGSPRR